MFSELTEEEVFHMRNCYVRIESIVPNANSSNDITISNVTENDVEMNEDSVSFDASSIETVADDVINVTGNITRAAPIQTRRKTEEVKRSKPFIIRGRPRRLTH